MTQYYFLQQKDVNKPNGKIKIFKTVRQISEFITSNNYSSGFYNPPKRAEMMWKKSNVLIIDIDEPQLNGKTMKEVSGQLSSYIHIVAPTKSYNIIKGANGFMCERYRILLFLSSETRCLLDYKNVVAHVCKKFELKADKMASDATHFFYASTSIYSIQENGISIDVNNFETKNENGFKMDSLQKSDEVK